MNVLKWIKEKYTHRRKTLGDHDPWWVSLMLDVGRPAVAVLILAMSAPGEHFVATLGGYSDRLAWGMPGALTAYAGIAAVVATKRPKGAPGRRTAIWGAILSIGIAMGAQPIAHLYGSGTWVVTPTSRVWLMIIVSCIPAAVFGHLLHMGAVSPKAVTEAPAEKPEKITSDDLRTADTPPVPDSVPEWMSDVHMIEEDTDMDADKVEAFRTAVADAYDLPVDILTDSRSTNGHPDRTPDMTTWTGHADTDRASRTTAVRPIKSGNVSAIVRTFLDGHPEASDADLSGHVRARKPDAKWDTIRKARDRWKAEQTEETG